MIQIDDAGSGSLIGGTCIGIYRPETNEYDFDIIPVEYYNEENFKKKKYLDKVVEIVQAAFSNLQVGKDEPIEVCRGYMFDRLLVWLEKEGYQWKRVTITGELQRIVEKSFELYACRLGLPENYIKYTRYPFHFHKLLRWVLSDYENRVLLCKVGWKSWNRYRDIKPTVEYGIMEHPRYYCLRCGRHIRVGQRVKKLHYVSNTENTLYLHLNCRSSTVPGHWQTALPVKE